MPSGIYAIENKINGRLYIGSAVDFVKRFYKHRTELKRGKHHSVHLQRAWLKYGRDAFSFRPIIFCAPKDLIMYEQRAIEGFDSFNSGYNNAPTAGSALGVRRSAETRAKMSASATGRKMSSEAVEKSRLANLGRVSPRKGVVLSDATRAKIKAARARQDLSPDHTKAIRSWWIGKKRPPMTAEHRAKLSAANIGHCRPNSQAAILKMSAAKAMFSPSEVLSMRAMYDGGMTATDVAKKMRCGLSTAHRIVKRKNYKHVN